MLVDNLFIKKFITKQFEEQVGYTPNIDDPKTFNEKIQWLKLYYHDPLMTKCADKYAVRKYIKEKIGEEYLVPLLGVYNNVNEIDFNKLPKKFVLKVNNASGKNIICKNKNKLKIEEIKFQLNEWLKPENNFYFYSYEWIYKDIKPKIICEKLLESPDKDLKDYKFMCFNGKVKTIRICSEREKKLKINFFDRNWNKLNFTKDGHPNNHKNIQKPKKIKKMIEISEILAKDFPLVRVDLYEINNKIYFGELTFTPGNGMNVYNPKEWDIKLGRLLKLDKTKAISQIKDQNIILYYKSPSIFSDNKIKFEYFSSKIFLSRISNSKTILDVGANIGFYSILAQKTYPKCKVISIEPVKETFNLLKKNIKLNKTKNIKIYKIAASNKINIQKINITKSIGCSSFYKTNFSEIEKTEQIITKPLDLIIKNQKIDFIKIDVEGHEIETLEGLKNTFKKNPNLEILIEFNPNNQISANRNPKEILNKLINLNFDLYAIIDYPWQKPNHDNQQYYDIRELYKITNQIDNWQVFVNKNHHVNLLCIPKNKSKLITFFSHSSQLAGSERSLLELIKELKEKNIFSHVVLPNEGPLIDELNKINIPYDIVNYKLWADFKERSPEEIASNITNSYINIIKYLPKLTTINPDLIYSNTIASPWGAVIANTLGKSHIWHIREYGNLDHNLKFDLKYPKIIKYIEESSDLILTNSNSVSEHILKYLKNKKPKTIYNFVEIPQELLNEKNKKIYKFKDSLKIIICGNVSPGKNQLEGIKAINELIINNINVELLVLGSIKDEDYFNKILEVIKLNNTSDRIHFIDFVNNPYPYIKNSDIVLIPSIKEAYGRTAVEGMLLKKVVIASSEGGTKEIIKNGKTGYIYKLNNTKSLSKIIKRLTDIKLRNKLSINGFNSLKYFNTKEKYGYQIAKYIQKISQIKKTKNQFYEVILNIFKNNFNELVNNNDGIENLKNELINKSNKIKELKNELNIIKSSKFFKIWPIYNKTKNILIKILKNN
jgi:FkbM family methyltransferase